MTEDEIHTHLRVVDEWRSRAKSELLRKPLPVAYDTEQVIGDAAQRACVPLEYVRDEFWQCVRVGELKLTDRRQVPE